MLNSTGVYDFYSREQKRERLFEPFSCVPFGLFASVVKCLEAIHIT